jgi:hypothetical protein
MAEGGKDPLWPMPTVPPKFATFSLGGGRPNGCAAEKCERWHAGIDLQRAPDKALVVAPEDGTIVGLDKGWTEGTRAIFFVTDSGLFLVLGGVIAGSHKEWGRKVGAKVARGGELGRIVGGYGMLHFETYAATPGRTANSRWWQDDPPPEGLLNPANYVERMVGKDASLLLTRQRLQALADLGYYKGDVGAAWGTEATEALKTAQAALGVAVDGKWGPSHRGRDPGRAGKGSLQLPRGLRRGLGELRRQQRRSLTDAHRRRRRGGPHPRGSHRGGGRVDAAAASARGDGTMKAYSKLPEVDGLAQLAQDRRRQGWALIVTGASTMLAGLVIGYAFGAAHTLRARRDGHGN